MGKNINFGPVEEERSAFREQMLYVKGKKNLLNHILLYCASARVLRQLIFSLFGIN